MTMQPTEFEYAPLQQSLSDAYGQMQANSFQKGFQSADLGSMASALETDALKALQNGDYAAGGALIKQAKGLRDRASGWAPSVDRLEEIQGVDDAASWAGQALGSGLRSTLPSIAGGALGAAAGIGIPAMLAARGIIGGGVAGLRAASPAMQFINRAAPFAGAMIPGYNMEMEEAAGQAFNDPKVLERNTPEEILGAARAKGAINMIPESVAPGLMFNKMAGAGARAIRTPMQALGRAAAGVGEGMLEEGLTEGVQNLVGQHTQAGLRGEQFNPDWMEALNDAAAGALFGGGMGTVGGVSNAAHSALRGAGDVTSDVGQGAQNILGRLGDLAQQGADAAMEKPTVRQGVETAKRYGQAAMDAAGRFADGARGQFQEGMEDLGQHINDSVDARKAGASATIMGRDAAEGIRKAASTVYKSVAEGIAQATGKKVSEAEAAIDAIGKNPFEGGYAEIGFDDPQAVSQHFSQYVQKNGETAALVARRLLDSHQSHLPEEARSLLQYALEKDENGAVRVKNGTVEAERIQGLVGLIMQGIKNRDNLKRSLGDIITSFADAQDKGNTAVPGKFSRQMTMQSDAAENVRQHLQDMGLDKQIVKKMSDLAGKGNKALFDMAVDRELLGKNLLGDIHEKQGAQLAQSQAQMIKELVGDTSASAEPKVSRSQRRKAKQDAHAIKSANAVDRNLSMLPHLIDEIVGQHFEESVQNAKDISGKGINTPDLRNMMSSALKHLVIGIIDDKVPAQQVAKTIAAAQEALGESGANMLDKVAALAEWHATRMDNPKIAERAGALRASLEGNGVGGSINSLRKVLGAKPGSKMLERTHNIMGQLINAYLDTYEGQGPANEAMDKLTGVKAQIKAYERQAKQNRANADAAEQDGDHAKAERLRGEAADLETKASIADFRKFELEKEAGGVDLHQHFRDEVKRITGKDVANKVLPIVEKRIEEIHAILRQPLTLRRKGDKERAGQYVPSKIKSSSNPNFGEQDENDNEARQALAEKASAGDEESGEMVDDSSNEGGTQGEVGHDFKHFGGAHGEPLTGKALGKMLRDIVDKYGLARTEIMNVREWAYEEAERTGRSVKSLLDEAAAARYKADKAQLERMRSDYEQLMSRATDTYARGHKKRIGTGGKFRDGQEESTADAEKRAGLNRAIEATEKRIEYYETVKGNGESYFAAEDKSTSHFRYVVVTPAHGAVGTGEVTEKTLDKYTVASVPKNNGGFKAPGVVSRSMMYLKNANGSQRIIDFGLMLFHQVSGSEFSGREADVSGAGEKNIEAGLKDRVRVAFAQAVSSMMLSNALSKEDTFFGSYGDQNYRGDYKAGPSKLSGDMAEFEFNPNMVIYRDPVNLQFLTYGQVFKKTGGDAITASKVTPTNQTFSDRDVESILPEKGVDVWSLDTRAKEHVVLKDWVSPNRVMANGGQRAHFSPRALLKEMMRRYGMRADEILNDSSDGISKTLAAKLIVEGLSVLKAQGWELTTDLFTPTVAELPLWKTSYGADTYTTTLGDLKDQILTRLSNGTAADHYGDGRLLSTDYRSDKVGRMTERLVEATKELSDAKKELALSQGKSSAVIADKKRRVSVKESAVEVLQNNLAIEQKLIYERKAASDEIENLDRRDREMPDQGGVVDIADGINAERRRNATLFDRSAGMSGDFSGGGHLAPKMVTDSTSEAGVRAVNGPSTHGMEENKASRRVVDRSQNTDQRAAFAKAKKFESLAGFENAPAHDTTPNGAGTTVEGGRPEGPSIHEKGSVKQNDTPALTMRSEDVRTTDSNALRRAKAAEAKRALDNEGRRLEESSKKGGARYSTNAVRAAAERARERAGEQSAQKAATPKIEAAKVEAPKADAPKLSELMQALVKDTLKLDTAAQRERISAIYNTQGPKVGKPLRDAVAAANPDLMDGSSVLFHNTGKFSLESTVATIGGRHGDKGGVIPSTRLKNTTDALDYIIGSTQDANLKAMAKAVRLALSASHNNPLIKIHSDMKEMLTEDAKMRGVPEEHIQWMIDAVDSGMLKLGGLFSHQTNEIHLMADHANPVNLLHEAAHAATLNAITRLMTMDEVRNIRTVEDLNAVFTRFESRGENLSQSQAQLAPIGVLVSAMVAARENLSKMVLKKQRMINDNTVVDLAYGLENLYEFIAEFFANQRFRNMLESMETKADGNEFLLQVMDAAGKQNKSWSQVVYDAIAKLINSVVNLRKNNVAALTGNAVANLLAQTSSQEKKASLAGKRADMGAPPTSVYSYATDLGEQLSNKSLVQNQRKNMASGKFSLENAGNAEGIDGRAQADHERRLGDAVDLLFDKTLPNGVSGQHVSAKDRRDVKNATKALNRVNPGAFSIRGSTAHENWHAVKEMLLAMGPEGQAIVDTIERAAHRPESLGWIAQQLAARGNGNEAALKQLADPEEASAFLFQFFVENEGKMPVPLGARGVLSRVTKFLKNLVGIRDDIIKAGDFFKYFNTGEFIKNHGDPKAVLNSMLKNNAEKIGYHLNKAVKPIRELASAAFGHAIDRIRDTKIPEYMEAIERYTKGWEGYAGYAEEQRARFIEFSNEYADIVDGHDVNNLPEAQQQKLAALVQRFEKYRKDAGLGSGYNTDRKNIPPSLDSEKISANLQGFKHDLLTYGGVKMNEGDVDAVVNQILVDGYWRDRDSLTGSSRNELFFDHPEIMNKWKSADKNQHAFTYFKEGTRAAELARINNPPSETGLAPLSEVLDAGHAKATPHQRKMVNALMAAYEGRSSYDMNPTLRKLFGAAISFMNMSLLPFALFSQMLEPMQLAFRKGSLDGTMRNAWRGLTDLPRTFEGVDSRVAKDKWEKAAGKLGLVPVHSAVAMMAELMSDIPLTGKIQKANQLFFRYNGMEQWSRSMHIAATQNAFEFIKHHDKHPTELGRRLLSELGLKPGQVRYAADGEVDFEDPAMRRAILQFVNESMAHPDPGTNTMWMNDPNFALVAHLKRFTFGFSYYIHGRAMNEIRNDNWKALLPLAYAIPWMIAVDGIKDFIKPGDEAYKDNWGVSDYVAHGVDRSGLLGRYGLGADMGKNIGFGGSGVESLAPTAEAVSKVLRGAAKGDTLDAIGNVMPGHQLFA